MNDRTNLVYKGFTELNLSEREELIKAVNEFINADAQKRTAINESLGNIVSKMDFRTNGWIVPMLWAIGHNSREDSLTPR